MNGWLQLLSVRLLWFMSLEYQLVVLREHGCLAGVAPPNLLPLKHDLCVSGVSAESYHDV